MHICKRNPQTKCGFQLLFADSTHNLLIPLTVCGFRLQLQIPQQLNSTIHMFNNLFVDSTNCSGFRKYGSGFRIFVNFWSDFERYSVLIICLWNPKQQRRSKKCSNVADSASSLIWACCGIRLQCTECTVWPRNDFPSFFKDYKNSNLLKLSASQGQIYDFHERGGFSKNFRKFVCRSFFWLT